MFMTHNNIYNVMPDKNTKLYDLQLTEIGLVAGGKCDCICWDDSGQENIGIVDDDSACNNQCLWRGVQYHYCSSILA